MKNLVVLALLAMAFISCESDDADVIQETEIAQVIGNWELYRDENLESIIDQWTGTEWTYVDQWFQNTRDDSQIILEFKEDGTFLDKYADVEVANGVWGELADGRYYFDYIQEGANSNSQLTQRRYITIHCDNTYSIEIEGNNRSVYYYRIIDSIECFELINYHVN